MKYINKLWLLLLGVSLLATACLDDLNQEPLDDDIETATDVFENTLAYKQFLAKIYAGMSVSGQAGPAGQPDISGIDEGFSTYLRQYWKAQELSTDEAVVAWNDGNIHDYHQQDWDAQNEFVGAMYNRIFYQIALCNEFLRETTDEKLTSRGQSSSIAEVGGFREEVRFMRALSYWHALDMFRNVPFVTEDDIVGAFFPAQISPADLFTYLESELKAIETTLMDANTNEYGRADKGAAWTLLAKLYLNAEVYLGTARYADCATYCQKVIDAGYQLDEEYGNLFLADNHTADGVIFPVTFDGTRTQTYGGMTFIVHAAVGGDMSAAAFGIDGGWGGIRTTNAVVDKFPLFGASPEGEVVVSPSEGNSSSYDILNVPGGYQGWDETNNETALASVNNDGVYEGYIYLTTGDQFKFAEGSWAVNYGDNDNDGVLESGGGNLVAPSTGLHKINVNLNDMTYTVELTTWGVIGSATPTGWDSDTDMTYNAESGALEIEMSLTGDEIKFRANDDWPLNYGDNDADATLEEGGANISLPEAGTYLIKLYLNKPDYTYSIERLSTSYDYRAMLFENDNHVREITDIATFTDGLAVTKFKNITSDGQGGSNPTFVDTDFPVFRVADIYLMYAESVVRDNSAGSVSQALDYVNMVRTRAYNGDTSGNIGMDDLTLDFLLDERSRELLWECHRRTDLIRFGKFSESTYLWPWKGGVVEGISTDAKYNIFPIPSTDMVANPSLVQNSGY